MARPKKNGVEQPLNLDGNNMPMENENAPQNQENAAQQQNEEQVKEHEEKDELPFGLRMEFLLLLIMIVIHLLSMLQMILKLVRGEWRW